jgi:hypothetical protein
MDGMEHTATLGLLAVATPKLAQWLTPQQMNLLLGSTWMGLSLGVA